MIIWKSGVLRRYLVKTFLTVLGGVVHAVFKGLLRGLRQNSLLVGVQAGPHIAVDQQQLVLKDLVQFGEVVVVFNEFHTQVGVNGGVLSVTQALLQGGVDLLPGDRCYRSAHGLKGLIDGGGADGADLEAFQVVHSLNGVRFIGNAAADAGDTSQTDSAGLLLNGIEDDLLKRGISGDACIGFHGRE